MGNKCYYVNIINNGKTEVRNIYNACNDAWFVDVDGDSNVDFARLSVSKDAHINYCSKSHSIFCEQEDVSSNIDYVHYCNCNNVSNDRSFHTLFQSKGSMIDNIVRSSIFSEFAKYVRDMRLPVFGEYKFFSEFRYESPIISAVILKLKK